MQASQQKVGMSKLQCYPIERILNYAYKQDVVCTGTCKDAYSLIMLYKCCYKHFQGIKPQQVNCQEMFIFIFNFVDVLCVTWGKINKLLYNRSIICSLD